MLYPAGGSSRYEPDWLWNLDGTLTRLVSQDGYAKLRDVTMNTNQTGHSATDLCVCVRACACASENKVVWWGTHSGSRREMLSTADKLVEHLL